MTRWLLARGKTFKPPSIYNKNVQPAIVVIVIKSNAATSSFQQIFVFLLSAKNGLCLETRLAGNIDKSNAQRRFLFAFDLFVRRRRLAQKCRRTNCPQDLLEGQNDSGAAE